MLATLITLAVTAGVFISVPAAGRAATRVDRWLIRVTHRSGIGELIVFIFALLLAAAPSFIWRIPRAVQPDEYSYLLAADTFAHGRLTNPASPVGDLLEWADILQTPTYASKYPPGQGLFLALGQLIWKPIAGAWLAAAIACAAVTWMLRGIVRPSLATIGGLLAAMHPMVAWWSQTYWGGSVAFLGGALLLGAALRRASVQTGAITGVALAILAMSRPFEGLIVALLIVPLRRGWSMRFILACAATLLPAMIWLGYYNFRVTGDWKTFPHLLHQRQHLITPRFFWEKPNLNQKFISPLARDYEMIDYNEYLMHLGTRNYFAALWIKTRALAGEYLWPFTLALAAFVGLGQIVRRARWARPTRVAALVVIALPVLHMAMIPITRPEYMAPAFGGLFVLAIVGAKILRKSFVIPALLAAQFVAFIQNAPVQAVGSQPEAPVVQTLDDLAKLNDIPGKHLVLVRYKWRDELPFDFVHNRADLASSKMVYAHSLNLDDDARLLTAFPDRDVWLLNYEWPNHHFQPVAR